MLWRLHLKPSPTPPNTHLQVVDYCFKNNIAGIGWPVEKFPSSVTEYQELAKKRYDSKPSSVNFASKPLIGEYIWARDRVGQYYLGKIMSDWYYSDNQDHLDLDIPNQRKCNWLIIGNEQNVPGKIVASFRARRTFQSIATSSDDSAMEEFSAWRFNNLPESGRNNQNIKLPDVHTFFQMVSSYDCEDLVGLYLQRQYGYCLIPSSCKIDTFAYEYLLKDPETGESVGVQVKQGKNSLDNSLSKSADKIFLFTTQGSVSPVDENVTVIQPEDLFVFVTRNANLIPDSVKMWLHFKQESVN